MNQPRLIKQGPPRESALRAVQLDPLTFWGDHELPAVGAGFAVLHPSGVRGFDLIPQPPGAVLAYRELVVAGVWGAVGVVVSPMASARIPA
jgi:hypothetical protein